RFDAVGQRAATTFRLVAAETLSSCAVTARTRNFYVNRTASHFVSISIRGLLDFAHHRRLRHADSTDTSARASIDVDVVAGTTSTFLRTTPFQRSRHAVQQARFQTGDTAATGGAVSGAVE